MKRRDDNYKPKHVRYDEAGCRIGRCLNEGFKSCLVHLFLKGQLCAQGLSSPRRKHSTRWRSGDAARNPAHPVKRHKTSSIFMSSSPVDRQSVRAFSPRVKRYLLRKRTFLHSILSPRCFRYQIEVYRNAASLGWTRFSFSQNGGYCEQRFATAPG